MIRDDEMNSWILRDEMTYAAHEWRSGEVNVMLRWWWSTGECDVQVMVKHRWWWSTGNGDFQVRVTTQVRVTFKWWVGGAIWGAWFYSGQGTGKARRCCKVWECVRKYSERCFTINGSCIDVRHWKVLYYINLRYVATEHMRFKQFGISVCTYVMFKANFFDIIFQWINNINNALYFLKHVD